MDTPSAGTPEPESEPKPAAGPEPIPLAYRLYEGVEYALEHHHQTCRLRPGLWRDQPVALRFSHDHDGLGIVVWTQLPGCLIAEMSERECHFDGVSLLAQYADDTHCPETVADLLALWGHAS